MGSSAGGFGNSFNSPLFTLEPANQTPTLPRETESFSLAVPTHQNSLFNPSCSGSSFGASPFLSSSLFASIPPFGTSNTPGFNPTPFRTPSSSFVSPALGFPSTGPGFADQRSSFGFTSSNNSPFLAPSKTPTLEYSEASQPSPFGANPFSAPLFSRSGQPTLASQHGGSGIAPYAITDTVEEVTKKMISISSMLVYDKKCHEELRWEDYQLRTKANPFSASQSSSKNGQSPLVRQHGGSRIAPYTASKVDGENFAKIVSISAMPLYDEKSHEELRLEDYQLRTEGGNVYGAFNWTSNLFMPSPSPIQTPEQPSLLSSATHNASSSCQSPSFQDADKDTNIPPIFQPSTCSGLTAPITNQFPFPGPQPTRNVSCSTTPWQTLTITVPVPSSSPAPNLNGHLCTACGCMKTNAFTFQFQETPASSQIESADPAVAEPPTVADNIVPVKDPFGVESSKSQLLAGHPKCASSSQIGISSMPVVDKHAPRRVSPLLTLSHVSQGRTTLQLNIWKPKSDVKKMPFFIREDPHGIPRPVNHPIPRENPKSAFMKVAEPTNDAFNGKPFHLNDESTDPTAKNNAADPLKTTDRDRANKTQVEVGLRSGNVTAEKQPVLPKLTRPDYYTEPLISELEVKESSDPGLCGRVRGFVIGRHGYGKIEFEGETDVRGLDLDSLVEFSSREVALYKDESKKVAVGKGLNKPAVVTLLNIKCLNKRTQEVYVGGDQVGKYRDMLRAVAQRQGAHFVSYDAVKGEWKFRVDHF